MGGGPGMGGMGGAGSGGMCLSGVSGQEQLRPAGGPLGGQLPGCNLKETPQTQLPTAAFCCTSFVSEKGPGGAAPLGSKTNPRTSIQEAINAAASGETICVCQGTFSENLDSLGKPISLLGGFDCAQWTRGEVPFKVWQTKVNSLETTGKEVFRATGASFGSTVVVDGIEFNAAHTLSGPARGVVLSGTGPMVFSNNHVTGGSGAATTTPIASLALIVDQSGSPVLRFNTIEGGSGTTGNMETSTVGVFVKLSSPVIVGNTIRGGVGTNTAGGPGSVGLLVTSSTLTGGNAVAFNDIHAGSGKGSGAGFSRAGVQVGPNAEVELTSNTIQGGSGDTPGAIGGVLHQSQAAVHLHANRIFGGDGPGVSRTVGVEIVSGDGGEIINNMIHGGFKKHASGGAYAVGLEVLDTSPNTATSLIVDYNTIYSGSGVGSGNRPSAAVYVTAPRTLVRSNMLMASEADSITVLLPSTQATTFTSFDWNTVLGTDTGFMAKDDGTSLNVVDTSSMNTALSAYAVPTPSYVALVRNGCSTMGCFSPIPVCGSGPGVAPSCLLGCWDAQDTTKALFGPGWQVLGAPAKADPVCQAVNIPVNGAPQQFDLYGAVRKSAGPVPGPASVGPTQGAAEYPGTCTPGP
jgi:hypothetical protein